MKSIIYLLILFFFISCEKDKSSKGFFDRVVVFSDKDLWTKLEEDVKESLSQLWALPRVEEKFRIEYHDMKNFDIYKNQRNLFFIVSEDKKNMLLDFVKQFFTKEAVQSYQSGQHHFFHVKDVYAKKQSVLIFVVKDSDDISKVYRNHFSGSSAVDDFYSYNYERISNELYSYSEQSDIIEKMQVNYPFSYRVPYKFIVEDFKIKEEENIFSMYKRVPFSWVWAKTLYNRNIGLSSINRELFFNLRDSLMKEHFDSETADRLIEMEEYPVTISGLNGVRFQGSYILNKDSLLAGGPYISYLLTDPENKRLYFLDGNLFNLGKRKSRDLLVIDEILKTFTLNNKGK